MVFSEPHMSEKIFTDPAEMPEQIGAALKFSMNNVPKRPKVCICGAGTSAMAGEVISDLADASSGVPVPVVRSTELPKWVDVDTAVIVISYSGNTPETLALYEQAVSRGCDIVCITSGGELIKRAAAKNYHTVNIPSGIPAGDALGYMIGCAASVLEEMGICGSRTELSSILPSLTEFRNGLKRNGNEASDIALAMRGRIPAVYSLINFRSAAMRWKMRIGENAGITAFCGTIPEYSHNEIVGWTGDPLSKEFIPMILCDDGSSGVIDCIKEALSGVLRNSGIEPYEFRISGKNDLEKNLKLIILGDFVSAYLANVT
ncbi:MAG: SIS domain-containing protein [Methanomassiliicoccaceae archaeon]|nr:SIS domain-containing protein [Methanomassiliicoccaceae archaeon]